MQLKSISNKKNPSLLSLASVGGERETLPASNRLLFELQSTLEIEQLLEIFFRYLNADISCHGLEYVVEPMELRMLLGEKGRHSAEYRLKVSDEELGKIRFLRHRPFTKRELEQIEVLLGILALPMRNAFRYHQALQAAYLDPLTGLKNRRSYEDNLEREISRARRDGQSLGLMVVDIDHFKQINDGIGHLAGDQVLTSVAKALKSSIRRSDLVFRYAGDEFVLLLPNIAPQCIHALAKRLENAVSRVKCEHEGRSMTVSVSIGSAILDDDMDGRQLFEAADLDMLCNKERRHREGNNEELSRRAG